ncbi:TIR domain-containing protein [Durusdinium trenchii]|uniref:TIR domain-containing protein n=1 Tax=Durusdinium trenchii TaxID=1381693 RepID=A0ABP0SLY9_9DINO
MKRLSRLGGRQQRQEQGSEAFPPDLGHGEDVPDAKWSKSLDSLLRPRNEAARHKALFEVADGTVYRSSLGRCEMLVDKGGLKVLKEILTSPTSTRLDRYLAVCTTYAVAFFPTLKMPLLEEAGILATLNALWWCGDALITGKVISQVEMMCFDAAPAKLLVKPVAALCVAMLTTLDNRDLHKKCLLTLLRISFHEECHDEAVASGVLRVLRDFSTQASEARASTENDVHWAATVALSNFTAGLDESHGDGVKASQDVLNGMVRLLKVKVDDGLGRIGRFFFSTGQVLMVVRNLALHAENARLLADLGVVNLVLKLLRRDRDKVRREVTPSGDFASDREDLAKASEDALNNTLLVAVRVLWTMSFDRTLASQIVEGGGMADLDGIHGYFDSVNFQRGVEAVQGVLFQIEGHQGGGGKPGGKPGRGGGSKWDVMISYQWDHQPQVLKMKNALEENGLSVWIDLDKMRGNILDQMAEAVEGSHVVIMCMTQKYYLSNNCHSEAQYAYALNKPIVPVVLEPGFRATGWLGLLLGMRKYVDMTGEFSRCSAELLEELRFKLGGAVALPRTPTAPAPTSAASSPAGSEAIAAMHDDVRKILEMMQQMS